MAEINSTWDEKHSEQIIFRSNELISVGCKRGTGEQFCDKVLCNGCRDRGKSQMGSISRGRVLMLCLLHIHEQQSRREERRAEKENDRGALRWHFKHSGIRQTHTDSGSTARANEAFIFRRRLKHEEECRASLQSSRVVITNSGPFFSHHTSASWDACHRVKDYSHRASEPVYGWGLYK